MVVAGARRCAVIGAVVVLAAVASPRAIAAEGDVTGFDVPTAGAIPYGITTGPDGAIWFTERFAGVIGRLDGGVFTEFPLPEPGVDPTGIVAGPDGNLWFVEQNGDRIGRMTTGGDLVEFPLDEGSTPTSIVSGPDGAMWFTERTASRIGRITTDGSSVITWPTLTSGASPTAITVGPDGALWFTERLVAKLGRITTDGTRAEFPLPAGSQPSGIATGQDGNLWVTLPGRNSVARVTPAGVLDEEIVLPTTSAGASHIVAGPQGALWFTETGPDKVGRITVDGAITEYPLAAKAAPQGIVEGPDRLPWFAEASANRIARLELAGEPVDEVAPTIEIRSPADGDMYLVDAGPAADYACVDDPGGSGAATCSGPVADGDPVPAGRPGAWTFGVHTADVAGNEADAATGYLVFRSMEGTLLTDASPRPGAWLTLSLGMDLDRGVDPIEAATTQEVGCDDGVPVGTAEPPALHTRVTRTGALEVRWDTEREWADTCRALTLSFSPAGWTGVPARFVTGWPSAARA